MKKFTFPLILLMLILLMSYFKYELGATEEDKKSVESAFQITKISPDDKSGTYTIKVDIIDDYYPSQIKEYSKLTIEKLIEDKELQGFDRVEIHFFLPHENGHTTIEVSTDNLEKVTAESLQLTESRIITETAGPSSTPDIEDINSNFDNLGINKRTLNKESRTVNIEVEITENYLTPQLKEHAYELISKIKSNNEYKDFEAATVEYYLQTSEGNQVQFVAKCNNLDNFSKENLTLLSPERNYNGAIIPEEEVK